MKTKDVGSWRGQLGKVFRKSTVNEGELRKFKLLPSPLIKASRGRESSLPSWDKEGDTLTNGHFLSFQSFSHL